MNAHMLGFRKLDKQGKDRRFRYMTGIAGVIMAIVFAAGCGAAQKETQDTVDNARDIINAIPTSPADVRDKVTEQLQTTELKLDSTSCKLSNSIAVRIKTLGNDWPTGPYMTIANYSATKDGDYKPVPENLYTAANLDTKANPADTWSWPCVTPLGKDKVGWYKVYLVHFDKAGKPDQATKTAQFEVVS